ncbi:hypothetical protein [Streptomyces scopuliridis]|uniref:PE domain-containing protein n=1 Tax=Streptomyces scopuliridis RB72 TaxID=1440053 RepID=A0A2T7TDE1_9ACTN|nr:hypothetical protein [Streptomyces scopuliridis]PVE13145.1 hypothetical protein Y717_22025 [Streptomyces scopuliridis RB72]
MTEPKTPAQLADDAAEAVRAINHATQSQRPGWEFPGDAYSVVGALARMAAGLPQALDQIGYLPESMAGNLRSDKGTLDADLEDTYGALADAHDAAQTLYEALNRAHSALSPIAYQD